MSEPAAESAAGPGLAERRQVLAEQREARLNPGGSAAGGSGFSRVVGGLPVWLWVAIAAVGAAAVWYLYKKSQSSSASSATSASSSSGTCLDASGQQVPCAQVDYGGQIATLQTEIQDLQGQSSSSSSAAASSAASSSSSAVVTGLRVTKVTSSTVSLAWNAVSGAFYYVVTYGTGSGSSLAVGPPQIVGTTTWTSPGLKSKTAYTFNVQVSLQGQTSLGPEATISATTS
jgi:hypothetical protein